MINHSKYDIVFSGWGAASCILLLEMEKQDLIQDLKILIIDPSAKKENDKTFCFWASKNDDIYIDYKNLISHEWSNIQINDNVEESINPLSYFHINSIDLYEASRALAQQRNISFLAQKVIGLKQKSQFEIKTDDSTFFSDWVFDCRPPDFNIIKNNIFYISQSFFGYKIRLVDTCFKKDVYHMMDFRVNQKKATQFVYILPYDAQTGLVELTRFGKIILEKEEAKKILQEFINENYGKYDVLEVEKGVIPMSSLSPKTIKKNRHVNIGTRGGSVKPSTGYAFKNMYKHAKNICANGQLKNIAFLPKRRFLFYDQLLLIILTLWPQKGKQIFERLFEIKSSKFVLKFLDEKSSFAEELSMFTKLQIGAFLKATIVWFFWKLRKYLALFFLIIYASFGSDSFSANQTFFSSLDLYVIILGLLLVGIPHGALDHLTEGLISVKKVTLKFIFLYLLLMVPIFLIWHFMPVIGLIFFLIYSAWHFGQTDMVNWGFSNSLLSFLWGMSLLCFLFGTHFNEFNHILGLINVGAMPNLNRVEYWSYIFLIWPLIFAIYKQKWYWLGLIVYLFLAQNLGLLLSFGFYFIIHHSFTGWLNLKSKLQFSHVKMYLHALPFNLGAIILYWVLFVKLGQDIQTNAAMFLVFLSCVSFPHVICMSKFYQKNSLGLS